MTNNALDNANVEARLESWKEIAAFLQRDISTVIRWEKHEGLPVRRHHHLSRSSVYAYASELEAWRANRKPAAEAPGPLWRRPLPSAAFALTLLLALVSASSGPQVGSVQAADGIVTRQVWGADFNLEGTPSPDGRYLAYDDETGNLAVRDLTTGQSRQLTSNAGGAQFAASLVFSPDGKQVAFGWYSRWDECDVRLVNTEGSEARVLYRADKHEIFPTDWSQDGKSILALRRRPDPYNYVDIVSVTVADGSVTVLKSFTKGPEPHRLRFSPDGRFVVYDFPADQKGNLDIFALAVAGGQVTPLVQHPAQEQLLGWTPDGKSVLFLSDRTGNWGVWLVPVADGKPQGEPTLVRREAGAMEPMGFANNGSFYYKIRVDGLNVYTATLGGGTPSLLVERHLGWNFQPEWSPDGKKVAYLSRRQRGSADATLCIRSVETGEEREYSDKLKRVSKWPLRWSPDGGSLLVRGGDLQGNSGLFTIGIGTEEVTRVAWWPAREYGSYMVEPCWSVDGKAVYYVEPRVATPEGRTRLVRTELATGRHEVIHVFPEAVTGGAVSLSPDGRWFGFSLIRGAGWSPAVMPVGGTEIRDLPGPWTGVRTGTWAPDSGQLLFIKRPGTAAKLTSSELWGVPVEGGEQRSLGFSVMKDVQTLSIHPDGKQLAFTAWEPATEVWVMENFLPGLRSQEEGGTAKR